MNKIIENIQEFAANEFKKEFMGFYVSNSNGTALLNPKGPYEIVDFKVRIREKDHYDEYNSNPSLEYVDFSVMAVVRWVRTGNSQKTRELEFDTTEYVDY